MDRQSQGVTAHVSFSRRWMRFGPIRCSVWLMLLLTFSQAGTAASPDERTTADPLGDAVRDAVVAVSDTVVRLRPIGSALSADAGLSGLAPTTGVVVSADGEILTSAFALQGNPQTVLVEASDGRKAPARIVATDHLRRLVLLKATEGQWKAAKPAQEAARVGQWVVGVGRFYSAGSPNVAVGIISALNRIHGMALQTDARISPMNYGGPLIDLTGTVHGILVPLAPRSSDSANAGVEWYDSGIGFAIPLKDALGSLEKLRQGKDLYPGRLGVTVSAPNRFSPTVHIKTVARGGPADKSGLTAGDQLVAVNGQPIQWSSMLESVVAGSYAGDVLEFDVLRGEERLQISVELVEQLPQVEMAWLGVLPLPRSAETHPENRAAQGDAADGAPQRDERDVPAGDEPGSSESNAAQNEADGVPGDDPASAPGLDVVALKNGPMRVAGWEGRVRLLQVDGSSIDTFGQLYSVMTRQTPGRTVDVVCRVDGESAEVTRQVTVAALPSSLDAWHEGDLAAVRLAGQNVAGTAGSPARQELQLADGCRCIVYSPPGNNVRPAGLVILLNATAAGEENVLRQWQELIVTHDLVVAIPVNPENAPFSDEDLPILNQAMGQILSDLTIDRTRMVVVLSESQAPLAEPLIFSERSPMRGIAMESGWIVPNPGVAAPSTAPRWALLLDAAIDRQSQALKQQAAAALEGAGLQVISVTPPAGQAGDAPSSATQIADWTYLIKTL